MTLFVIIVALNKTKGYEVYKYLKNILMQFMVLRRSFIID